MLEIFSYRSSSTRRHS